MKCICFNRMLKTFILFIIIFFKQNVRVSCISRNGFEQQEEHLVPHQEPLQGEYDTIDDNVNIHDIGDNDDDGNNDIQIGNILGRLRTSHINNISDREKRNNNNKVNAISNNDYNNEKNIGDTNTGNDNDFLLSSKMESDISDGSRRRIAGHDDIGFDVSGCDDGINDKNTIGYKMYNKYGKELDQLSNFAQNKVRRSSKIMVNKILEKHSKLLTDHFKKKVQSDIKRTNFKKAGQTIYNNQQQDGESHLSQTPQISSPAVDTTSIQVEKFLNVLTPYYGKMVAVNKLADSNGHYKHQQVKQQKNKGMNIISNKNEDVDYYGNGNIFDAGGASHSDGSGDDDGGDVEKLKLDGNETLYNDEELLTMLSQLQTIHQDKDYAEIYDQACEICSPDIQNKHCCSMIELTKSKRQISPTLSLSSSSPSSLQSDSTRPFMNSNPSSIYPGVVVKTSPSLSTYNKLIPSILPADDNDGGVGSISNGGNSRSSNTSHINNVKIGTNSNSLSSYADFLNYYELQQEEQQQQQQQTQPNLTARDINNTINTQLPSAQLPPPHAVTVAILDSNGDGNNVRKSATEGTTRVTTPQSTQNNTNQQQDTSTPSPSILPSQSNNITIEQLELIQQQQPFNNITTIGYNDCPKYIDVANATAVLERVLEELELIRQAKEGSMTPEGAPCKLLGSWNSEIIGLRFDINVSSDGAGNLSGTHDLSIKLFDHNPPKRNTLMDSRSWTCTGRTLHGLGGPFYITAMGNKDQVLAIFTGLCKTCGGADTIFGTWSIVHHAKDCRDLQMSIETKRDIFRKEMLYIKKNKKLEKLKMNSNAHNGNDNIATETSKSSDKETEKPLTTTTLHPTQASKSTLSTRIGANGKTIHAARNYYYYY